MNEKEFDIQVRNLLRDAQEPVSPKVWEGVAAGLDKRRRAVPVRFWGYAASMAAAAAVALLVLLRPAAPVVPEPGHSNHSIFMSEVSGETVPQQGLPVPRTKPLVLAQAPSPVAPEALPEVPAPVTEATEAPAARPAPQEKAAPEEKAAPQTNDNALLNQLAFEEKAGRKNAGGISVLAYGNVQTSQRSGIHNSFRRFGAPSRDAETGVYNESPEISFALPFSLGVGVQFNLSPHWAVGTGIRYTNLGRTLVGDYKGEGFYLPQTDIDNHQHWLGVPVHLYYNFVNTSRWSVHAFAGGAAEWLIDNEFLVHNSPSDIHYHQKGTRPQWSGALGLGVEFKLTPYLGIYLDPSVRYFFATEKQPRSLRTVQPLRFDLEAGLRFSLGK